MRCTGHWWRRRRRPGSTSRQGQQIGWCRQWRGAVDHPAHTADHRRLTRGVRGSYENDSGAAWGTWAAIHPLCRDEAAVRPAPTPPRRNEPASSLRGQSPESPRLEVRSPSRNQDHGSHGRLVDPSGYSGRQKNWVRWPRSFTNRGKLHLHERTTADCGGWQVPSPRVVLQGFAVKDASEHDLDSPPAPTSAL